MMVNDLHLEPQDEEMLPDEQPEPLSVILRRSVQDVLSRHAKSTGGANRWGDWRYAPDEPSALIYEPDGLEIYDIVLTRVNTTAKLCNVILELKRKKWATETVINDFVLALNHLENAGIHHAE
jgi:hypothetical protein